ncbi:MAG: Crp/Fnr family transcriptional regulator, partial [Defluviitaleaceae bacterium]|nr:Crp/Fnr family transcriptional regulator [Defluviitaleaceae bacterium]
NTSVAATLKSGEVFGDICAGIEKSETTARAFTSSQIMFIEYRKITGVCREACEYHIKTLCNLLGIFAAKNRALSEDLQVLQKRTTREKLLAYLYIHAKKADSPRFNIPFNREGLAEYLRIDRSAMSRELCAMRDEGLLEFYKNSFILLGEN